MYRKSYTDLTRLGKNKRQKTAARKGREVVENQIQSNLEIPSNVVYHHVSSAVCNNRLEMPMNENLNLSGEFEQTSYEVPSYSNELIGEEELRYLSSDSDDNDESYDNDEFYDKFDEVDALKKSLRNWAVSFNVSLVSLTFLLCILRLHKCFNNLPSDARSLLKTPYSVKMVPVEPGHYSHIGLARNLRYICEKMKECITNIELLINVDGLPLFKSSCNELWPILGKIINVPSVKSIIFPIGIYCGPGKPKSCTEYLKEFVEETKKLIRDGLCINDKVLSISIKGFILDTPAKSFLLNTKGHTGYYSCTKCTQSGVWLQNRMTFPELNAPLRSHEAFLQQEDEDFHCGETLLTTIPGLHFIHSFPLDYMHLVCLGVVRSIMYLWIFVPSHPQKLPSKIINEISSKLVALKSSMPAELNRKPRSLNEIKRWKATEFRQFLLYTGPVVLKQVFIKEYESLYYHFLSLSISISILLSPKFCINDDYCKYAENLLKHFVTTTMHLYGHQFITSNMHGLVHLVDNVEHFGPLDFSSSFSFENYLQNLKKMVRKGDKPLPQVIKRLSEIISSDSFLIPSTNTDEFPKFAKPHFQGPLLNNSDPNRQYSSIQFSNYSIETTSPNSCCIFKCGSILLVENVVFCQERKRMVVIGREFLQKTSFYSSPFLDSSDLGVHIVSNLSDLLEKSVSHISGKMVLLPFEDKQVAFPLLHSL